MAKSTHCKNRRPRSLLFRLRFLLRGEDMGKQQEKHAANTTDRLFVFGIDEEAKPRGARFADFNDKIVNVAAEMRLTSVYPASAAFTEIAMKLPAGRLYASGKAFVPPVRRDLVERLEAALATPGDESKAHRPAAAPAQTTEETEGVKVRTVSPISSGLPRSWDSIGVGHVVLGHAGPEDGWWECVVLKREDELLTLRLRDYPKQGTYLRHVTQVALINPGPE
jgi:hypothetical protein